MGQNKVAIITGAAGGIGRATALRFASEGYKLVLADLNGNGLQHTLEQARSTSGADCLFCPGDLSDIEFLRSLVIQSIQRWNRLDVVVNNAAWRTIETMRTLDLPTWEKTLRVCLTAPAFLAKWAAVEMEKHTISGVIVNVSSVMAERAGGTSPAYIAAKGGLESLTRELAITYGRSGIRVVGVAPGSVDTALSNDYTNEQGTNISARLISEVNAFTPLGRAGRSEEIAEAIYWLSSEKAAFITGTTVLVDGGLTHNFSSYTVKNLQFPDEY